MRNTAVWLFACIAALTVPLIAQSGSGDTLAALLSEVHQLRIAMERAATTTPQIQLLGTRLAVQNERLARADQDHENVRQELEGLSATIAQMSAQAQELERLGGQEANPEQQRRMESEQGAAKRQIAEMTIREQRLRARESDLAAALAAEQNQWADLNRRLDEAERSLGARDPR
jgi:hypothetical protein